MNIEGSRVELRPLTIEDISHVMSWVNNPDVVKNFQNFQGFTWEAEMAFINKITCSSNDRPFSIFRKTDGAYIGQCAINQISWQNRLGRLAVTIIPEHQGQKYSQEIIPLLIKYAFEELKLHKVWIMFYASNKKMHHLCTKLDFELEGIKRDHYLWHDEYHDVIEMAKINW